eukprot:2388310-Pleurochrysis_carterae.AAC.1
MTGVSPSARAADGLVLAFWETCSLLARQRLACCISDASPRREVGGGDLYKGSSLNCSRASRTVGRVAEDDEPAPIAAM